MELALMHGNAKLIVRSLENEGLGHLLEGFELDSIVAEAESIRRMLPERPRKTLPRVIGMVAIIMGLAGMWIGMGGPSVRRYSPGSYGIAAVILGVILILKPSWAKTDI